MKINIENFKIFYSSFLGKSITQIILKKFIIYGQTSIIQEMPQ